MLIRREKDTEGALSHMQLILSHRRGLSRVAAQPEPAIVRPRTGQTVQLVFSGTADLGHFSISRWLLPSVGNDILMHVEQSQPARHLDGLSLCKWLWSNG